MFVAIVRRVRQWWFLRQCQQVERSLVLRQADAEIETLQYWRG